jgi:soluble lytic murein transglycosylase-like protein
MRPVVAAAVLAAVVLLVSASEAGADIYKYVDDDGVVHFTNIRPTGKDRKKWRKVMSEAPPARSKPAARRGTCERCDVVPSKDSSPERFSRYDAFIYEAADLYKIPPELIRAVIKVESDYDPRVVSAFGARGLMQLMPSVVEDMGVSDVHDPRENILGGTRLLRVLANRYEGDLVRVVAAYHAGMGSMARYGDNVPPYPNTRKYLKMVLARYHEYKEREAARSR